MINKLYGIAAIILLLLMSDFSLTAQVTSFADDFSDNSKSWPFLGDYNDYSIQIKNGHMVLSTNSSAIHTYQKVEIPAEGAIAYYTNMIFVGGDHRAWIGFRFNMSPDASKYLSFVLNNDKEFLIAERNGKKYEVLRQSRSQVIKPYEYNSLTIIKKGSTYKFLINDKQVHEQKTKSFFGPLLGIIVNSNAQVKVDEVQVYDPDIGRLELEDGSHIAPHDVIGKNEKRITSEFQDFMNQFARVSFPYHFSPQNAQGVDVSHFPIVQRNFYKYVSENVSDKRMWALCQLSDCGEGYALLMMNRYQIYQQDISRFFVAIFNPDGTLLREREIGIMVKENGSFFKTIEFKAYKDGLVMNIESIETFSNGNKNHNSIRYHTAQCN